MKQHIFLTKKDKRKTEMTFGIRLDSIPSQLTFRSSVNMSQPLIFSDLINQMHITDIPVTYSLRTIFSVPESDSRHVALNIVLFITTVGSSLEEATQNSELLLKQMMTILLSTFPEHHFSLISNEREFKALFQPEFINDGYFCEIRKRETLVQLNSVKPQNPFGFPGPSSNENEPSLDEEEYVYFPHPFFPRTDDYDRLFRIFFHLKEDFMIIVNMTPTAITPEEEKAILAEIAKCEGYEPEKDRIIQRRNLERTNLLGQGLLDQFLRFQDAPFYFRIILASPAPIERAIAEAVGSSFSQPVGSVSDSGGVDHNMQKGGYDILIPSTEKEVSSIKNDLLSLGAASWGTTLAPEPLRRLRFFVDGFQAASGFRFPIMNSTHLMGIKTHRSKQMPLPIEMGELHTREDISKKLIGKNSSFGFEEPVYLTEKDLSQHMYIVGQTGTGKTTLLKSMILGDIESGKGVAVIDPHGDLYNELMGLIPENRIDDVVLLNPLDIEFPVGFNLLEPKDLSQRIFIAREIKAIMHRLLHDTFGSASDNYIGPIFYKHLQMNLLLTMSDPENPGTLLEFYEIFQHQDYWKRWLPLKWDDPLLQNWVEEVLPGMNYTFRTRTDNVSMGEYVGSKFDEFVLDPRLRLIFGQKESTIDFKKIMDEGKILLINLAKGPLGEATSQFLGLILMAKFQSEILGRGDQAIARRKPFTIYIDEFQSLATENFSILLSEARKFGVSLVLANQFVSQIKDHRILEAIFGNVGTILAFRVGKDDAAQIETQFLPEFNQFDLANLPNWNACIKTCLDGQIIPPFTFQTLEPELHLDTRIWNLVLDHARNSYGRSRKEVENIIRLSLNPSKIEEEKSEMNQLRLIS